MALNCTNVHEQEVDELQKRVAENEGSRAAEREHMEVELERAQQRLRELEHEVANQKSATPPARTISPDK